MDWWLTIKYSFVKEVVIYITFPVLLYMMMSSNGNMFRVTGHLCREFTGHGEFPGQRPVTRSFGVFFDLRHNKRLSKQSWDWWFETTSSPLCRHCNDMSMFIYANSVDCDRNDGCIDDWKRKVRPSSWVLLWHIIITHISFDVIHRFIWQQIRHLCRCIVIYL